MDPNQPVEENAPVQSTLPALVDVQAQREKDPKNLTLRDTEHALFSQYVIESYGPVLGRAIVAVAVPSYSSVKALAQYRPDAIGEFIKKVSGGHDPRQATPRRACRK